MSDYPRGDWPTPQSVGPAPLDQPQYDATVRQAVARFWRKFATFSGRASRSEYWWWALVSFVISVVLQLGGTLVLGRGLFQNLGRPPPFDLQAMLVPLIPALVWTVVALVPSIALVVRRLHDTNRRGWWYLLGLPSLIGLPLQLQGLASFDPERVAAGDSSGLAIAPLAIGGLFSLLGTIGSIVVLVFLILGPDQRGTRFDRKKAVPTTG